MKYLADIRNSCLGNGDLGGEIKMRSQAWKLFLCPWLICVFGSMVLLKTLLCVGVYQYGSSVIGPCSFCGENFLDLMLWAVESRGKLLLNFSLFSHSIWSRLWLCDDQNNCLELYWEPQFCLSPLVCEWGLWQQSLGTLYDISTRAASIICHL